MGNKNKTTSGKRNCIKIKCFYCKNLLRKSSLKRHNETVRCWAKPYMDGDYVPPEGDKPCTRCRQWCNGGESCDEKLANLENEDRFKCSFCPKQSNDDEVIRTHNKHCFYLEGANFQIIKCFRCSKNFKRHLYLDHLHKFDCKLDTTYVKPSIPYPCVFCGCFYRDKKNHKCRHMPTRVPLEESYYSLKRFRCNECPFGANTRKTLCKHKNQLHPKYSRLSTAEKRKLTLRLKKQIQVCTRNTANLEAIQIEEANEPVEDIQKEAAPEPTFSGEETPDGDSTVKEEIPEPSSPTTNSSPVQETLELDNPRLILVKPKDKNTKKITGFPKSTKSLRKKQKTNLLHPTLHLQNRKHNQCRKCKAIFTRLSTLTQHVRVCNKPSRDNPVLKDPRVPCMYCLESLPNSDKLQEHLKESACRFTTDPASGHCPHCDEMVEGNEQSTDTHFMHCKIRRIVAPGKNMRCDKCNNDFEHFDEHLADYNSRCRNEFRQSGFTCGMCSFIGQEAIIMIEHCRLVHKLEVSPTYVVNKGEFYCFVCGESYDNEFESRLDARDCMRTHGYDCKTTNEVCSADIDVD